MTAPLFSIVTPVYDPPVDVLRETVGSVLAQDLDDWELILVDDVYTSGATVSAAASALRKAGARRVDVVTFARAVR